jgi:hypothetical protein
MLRRYLVQTNPAARPWRERISPARDMKPVSSGGPERAAAGVRRIPALFARYLFFRLHEDRQSRAPVRSSVGVTGCGALRIQLLGAADLFVTKLRASEDRGSGLYRLVRHSAFAVRSLVRVTAGVFEGLGGIFQREDGANLVMLILNPLGWHTGVCLAIDAVAPQRP